MMRLKRTLFFWGVVLPSFGWAAVPTQPSVVTVQGTQLMVQKRLPDGTLSKPVPYTIKGIDWQPATRAPDTGPIPPGYPIPTAGSNQYGYFYDWSGRNPEGDVVLNYWLKQEFQAYYLQDIPLMAQMHVNTVRVFGDFGDDPTIYGPILDAFYNNNIMVIMTVASSADEINSAHYQTVVNNYKNHPAILTWTVGNEWNLNNLYQTYPDLPSTEAAINQVIPVIKTLDNNHPVSSSLGYAGSPLGTYANAVPGVDIWSLNVYTGKSFGTLFTDWASEVGGKPFFFGEFGIDSFNSDQTTVTAPGGGPVQEGGEAVVGGGTSDEADQSIWDLALWGEVQANLSSQNTSKICAGGVLFSWNDQLYEVGDYNLGMGDIPPSPGGGYASYDTGGFYLAGASPDNVTNEEYFGIVDADRNPKQAYSDMQTYYSTLAPLPLDSITVSTSSATVHYNDSVSLSAQGVDVFQEVLFTTPTFNWSVSPSAGVSISTSGLFSSFVTSGTFVVSVTSGVIVSTIQVIVANAPPTVATPASAAPDSVIASSTTLSVLGDDDRGEPNISYTWASAGPAAVSYLGTQGLNSSKTMGVAFSSAGIYAFTVTLEDLDGATTTSQVSVTVQPTLTQVLGISPSSVTVNSGAAQVFSISALDQFGHGISIAGIGQWDASGGGVISSGGVFTAGTSSGTFTVTYTSGVLQATASVTVDVLSPTASFPAPTIGFGDSVPVNGELTVSLPTGFDVTRFAWALNAETSRASTFRTSSQISTASDSFNITTTQGILNLSLYSIPAGYYLVTVQAFGANGAFSPPAQAFVTLVQVPADFAAFRLFPSPWRSDLDAGHPIIFDGLTSNTTIKIFTVSGHWVQTLGPANGSISWYLKNSSGDLVASGLYFYLMTNDQGQKASGKFAIIR